jgi:hypothetical protein
MPGHARLQCHARLGRQLLHLQRRTAPACPPQSAWGVRPGNSWISVARAKAVCFGRVALLFRRRLSEQGHCRGHRRYWPIHFWWGGGRRPRAPAATDASRGRRGGLLTVSRVGRLLIWHISSSRAPVAGRAVAALQTASYICRPPRAALLSRFTLQPGRPCPGPSVWPRPALAHTPCRYLDSHLCCDTVSMPPR